MSLDQCLNPNNDAVIKSCSDWREAVTELVNYWTAEGRPFSSGEVAAAIRTFRPDLAFAVPSVGGMLRDLFYGDALPEYADLGDGNGPQKPIQRSRFTTGKYRTPAGVEVFVYGRDADACDNHEFEVWIPSWDSHTGRMLTQADCPTPVVTAPSIDSAPGSAPHTKAQKAYAKTVSPQTVATVWTDNRMAVLRSAFEALCHLSAASLRAGDPVFVKVEPGVKVTITLDDQGNGAKPYKLVAEKKNVAFYSGDPSTPFTAGNQHPVTVTASGITVDLTKVL